MESDRDLGIGHRYQQSKAWGRGNSGLISYIEEYYLSIVNAAQHACKCLEI